MIRRRRNPLPKRAPPPLSPDPAEREYYRNLRRYAEAYERFMRKGLEDLVPSLRETASSEIPRADSLETRLDANIEKRLRDLFGWVNRQLEREFPEDLLKRWSWYMVDHVNKIGKKSIAKLLGSAKVEAEPLMRDGELTPYFQNVVDENVGLIRSIGRRDLEPFKDQLVYLITSDAPQDTIREAIQRNFGITRNRARLIARDQVGKLNGKVTQYRQQSIGGKRYIWDGVDDGRERDDHKRLNGKVFEWSKPPIVDRRTGRRGHPGEDYQCRCRARMVLEDVIE